MEWHRLAAFQPKAPARFDPATVAHLPEPARRYLAHAICPGTPLLPVATLRMAGQFSLGTGKDPAYRPMQARQILAAPEGFLWALRLPGRVPVSGSDSGSWTRFRILGLIPVARAGADANHARSAFGRAVAEAAIWTPAALLLVPGTTWEAVDDDTFRVTMRRADLVQPVDITVDARGAPVRVVFQRWTNANPEGRYRLQPFGALPSDFRDVGGYRLPFRVEAGNMFGTDDWFAFFRAEVTEIAFPEAPG